MLLASNSPRRRQLIALGKWNVSLSVSDVDEGQSAGESPSEYVLRLAEAKARAAIPNAGPEQVIIGADTAVIHGGRILGKPGDSAEAIEMLKELRGHTHQVYTALAILQKHDERLIADLCVTDVPMRNYTDEEIDAYVLSGDPLDKAGAYGIQHPSFHPVESMSGCYASVMGLPMCHLLRALRQLGITSVADVPAACQTLLQYACPVSRAILHGEQVG